MEITKKIYYSLYLFFSIISLSNCVLEIPLKPMVVKGIPKYKNITRVEPEKNLVYNNSTMLYEEGNSFINSEHLFVSTIKIGSNSQTFNLIMDTGSPVLWVAQPNCKGTHKITRFFNPSASSTARGTTQPMKIQYGTGYAEGYFYTDNFEYLLTRKFNLYFGLAYTADFLVTDADGIVGLSKSYDETRLSFIHMMKSAGNTDSTAFSFKFESDIFYQNIKGSMFIGEHEDFSKSEAISAPLTFYGNKIFWACEISSFSMKGTNYETKSNYETRIIFDTGTNAILLPTKYLEDIKADLPDLGCFLNRQNKGYQIVCEEKNDYPDMRFKINGNTLIIPYQQAFYKSSRYTGLVFSQVVFDDSQQIYIFGSFFFFLFHTLFDEEEKVLKFYPLKGTIESGLTTFVIVLIVIACTVVVVGIAIGVYIGVTKWKKRNNNMLQANLIQNNYGNLFGQNNIN